MRARNIACLTLTALLGLGSDWLEGSPSEGVQTQVAGTDAMAANADLPMEVQAKLAELQTGVTSAHKKGNARPRLTSLLVLGNMQMQVSSYRDALESYNRALEIAQADHLRQEEAAALNGQGNYFRTLLDNDKAMEKFAKALDLASAADDLRNQTVALNGIGWVKVGIGQHDQGLEFHNRALAIADKINDPDLQASVLNRLGTLKEQYVALWRCFVQVHPPVGVLRQPADDVPADPRDAPARQRVAVAGGDRREQGRVDAQHRRSVWCSIDPPPDAVPVSPCDQRFDVVGTSI